MKESMKALTILCGTALAVSAFTLVVTTNWKVEEGNYDIKFYTTKGDGKISGLRGTIDFDAKNPAASNFDVTVDVKTLDMYNAMKTEHALAPDFFDVAKYPTIRFQSTKFEKTDNGYEAIGKLTLKDVTREIKIPFTFQEKGKTATLNGTFEINRTDYGLPRNGPGEIMKIELKLPLRK